MAKICIDPGHYGKYNKSPAVPEYYESEMAWKLSYMQKEFLENMGHEVVMTRTNQGSDLGLDKRGKKSLGCDLFISNHSNAVGGGVNESVDYAAIYHLVDDATTKCDDISKEIASKLAPVVSEVMGVQCKILTRKSSNDRNKDGYMNDNYYGVLNGARSVETPGLILEHSFHTNTNMTKWLLDENNLNKLAEAESKVIDTYFRSSAKDDISDESEETSVSRIPENIDPVDPPKTKKKVEVSIKNLRIRKGPGTNNVAIGLIKPGIYEIDEIVSGTGSKKGWAKLSDKDNEYISMDYVKEIK